MPTRSGDTPQSLRQARKEAGLNQAALAETVGIDRTLLCRIELGERTPTPDVARRIAAALGVDSGHFKYPQGDPRITEAVDRVKALCLPLNDEQRATLAVLLVGQGASLQAQTERAAS